MLAHEHRDTFSDDVLLQHVSNGCEECFAVLFHRYFRQVLALAFKILRVRSEAEDILQEVFLAIFLQRERFDPAKGSVKTWILQFAYFRSLLRRRYLRVRNFYKQEEVAEGQQIRAGSSESIAGMNRSEWCHSPKFRPSLESTACEISSDPLSAMNSIHERPFVALVRRPPSPVSVSPGCND